MSNVTEGTVAFCNLTEHEQYQGQSTGRYSIVITMDPTESAKLAAKDVRLKEYTNKETDVTVQQRKFASKYHVNIVDVDGNPVSGEVPYGSKVRLLWKDGAPHPQWKTPTYLEAVRVLELADVDASGGNEDF